MRGVFKRRDRQTVASRDPRLAAAKAKAESGQG